MSGVLAGLATIAVVIGVGFRWPTCRSSGQAASAVRHDRAVILARDTIFVSTALSVPLLLVITALLT